MGYKRNMFFKEIAAFWAYLPYNLNWAIKKKEKISKFLNDNPIVCIDIGARGGSLGEIENLKENIIYYGFDADDNECKRINENPPKGFYSYNIFPYFVGEKKESIDFHLYFLEGQSSSYIPNQRFKTNYGGEEFKIVKTFQCPSETLDNIISNENLKYPDIIKLDTQGSEFSIIQSAPNAIKESLLIETEVEFVEMYDKQPLFHDISAFLYERGYEILYLNRVFHNRKVYNGEAKGQLIWGDALFGLREDKLSGFSINKIAKYVIMLINYGHIDFAADIIEKYPDVLKLIPDIQSYFKLFNKGFFGKLKRVFFMQLDKFALLYLNCRKTNKNNYDSDRSWPIR